MKSFTFILFISFCLTPLTGETAALHGTSNIKILKPITFIEEKKLSFGTIVTPGNEETLEISLSGNVNPSTTAQHLDSSKVSEASVKISGSSNNNINISAEYLENEPNIDVLSMKASYDDVVGDLMNGMGNLNSYGEGKSLKFGAGIKISSAAVEGDYFPVLKLSVNYE